MALTSVQEQVDLYLRRRLVETRTAGTPSVQIEAAAVLETVALNLTLYPRVVFYLHHLARNGLLKLVEDELLLVAETKKLVEDLGNPSYAIKDLSSLKRARTSLLALEGQGSLTSSGSFRSFDAAVTEFLNKHLAKNVRKSSSPEMVRPGAEAAEALPAAVASLTSLHEETLLRLSDLLYGVQEYEAASAASGGIGKTVAFRIRQDIETILDELEEDSQAVKSREYAVRLVAARAVLQMLATPPSLFDDRINTEKELPYGYSLEAVSPSAPVELRSSAGPWGFATTNSYTFTVSGQPGESASLPVGTNITPFGNVVLMALCGSGDIDFPASSHLFFSLDGTVYRIPINPSTSSATVSRAAIIAAIEANGGGVLHASAESFGMYVYGAGNTLEILSTYTEGHVGSTSGVPTEWSSDAYALLSFLSLQASIGTYTPEFLYEALTYQVMELSVDREVSELVLSATLPPGSSLSMTSVEPGGAFFGASRTLHPEISTFSLFGEAPGLAPGAVSPVDLVDPGDVVVFPAGSRSVESVEESSVVLASPVRSYSGPFRIESGLLVMWRGLLSGLSAFTRGLQASGYADGLGKLDVLIAPLYGSPTPARRQGAIDALQVLENTLSSLQTVLRSNPLPYSGGAEVAVTEGIVSTLTERKYDRALAMLLRGRPAALLSMDWQTVSFGGELMAAASEVARSDISWPNPSMDEGSAAVSVDTTARVSP